MDKKTLAVYDREASAFANDWHAQRAPADMYAILHHFFSPGLTADIGCGAGRDTAWLNANGFRAIGYDASEGLLAEARRLYPGIDFRQAALPALAGITHGSFTNVLCETVIMHLDCTLIESSVQKLLSLLEPDGTLYLSWRVTKNADKRDDKGRLYAAFDPDLIRRELRATDILLDEHVESASSGKAIHRIVARKTGSV